MTTPVPGSPEHDAAMIALAESAGVRIRVSSEDGNSQEVNASELKDDAPVQATAEIKERPADVPEKFWDAEKGEVRTAELLKSYRELESSRSAQVEAKPKASPAPAAVEPTADQKAAQAELAAATTDEAKAAAQAKLDKANADAAAAAEAAKKAGETKAADLTAARAKATEELSKDGKISDATYAQLEAVGYDRATVDEYVAGMQARAELVQAKVFLEAGSQENYVKMTEWATANWSQAEQDAFNAAVDTDDMTKILTAVKGLAKAYKDANGEDATTRIVPNNGGKPTGDMFRSKEEVSAAMNDKRYLRGDKAFHAEVDRKLENAIKAGIDLGF